MYIVTSESVFSGHPDKVCDQISDAILDEILKEDKNARVAVECAIKDDYIFIFGEVSTIAKVNYGEVALRVLKDIGYEGEFNIIQKISEQSPDIAVGVNEKEDHKQGAGDQGMMYGYACNETTALMPFPIVFAHEISKRVDEIRKEKYNNILGPDGKCQVFVMYDEEYGFPTKIDTIVISAQTKPGVDIETVRKIIKEEVLHPIFDYVIEHTKILINPTGAFVTGGPYADSGLTGRKIMVDTYGGYARHGGGAFSGKDVSKVDRSAAYYARYVAKSIVKAELADQCEVCISYSIGIAKPVSVNINTFGTGVMDDESLLDFISQFFDFTPSNIRRELELDKVKFKDLACYGHMGRTDLPVKWEHVNKKVKALKVAYEEA